MEHCETPFSNLAPGADSRGRPHRRLCCGPLGVCGRHDAPIHPEADELPLAAGLADPGWPDAIDEARRVVRASVVEQNLPGLSAAVGIGDRLVWSEGFGWANLDSRDPVTPTTRFRVGTLSTVFTSAAVGLFLDEGLLDLDAPLTAWTLNFNDRPTPITLRQAMAHVAGIRPDEGDEK